MIVINQLDAMHLNVQRHQYTNTHSFCSIHTLIICTNIYIYTYIQMYSSPHRTQYWIVENCQLGMGTLGWTIWMNLSEANCGRATSDKKRLYEITTYITFNGNFSNIEKKKKTTTTFWIDSKEWKNKIVVIIIDSTENTCRFTDALLHCCIDAFNTHSKSDSSKRI